ncbi:MAG: hypothetical protein ABSB57_00220 [Dehalococcoidia bacterium]
MAQDARSAARLSEGYRVTLETLIVQTTLWENRINGALLLNGGLVALVGAFR